MSLQRSWQRKLDRARRKEEGVPWDKSPARDGRRRDNHGISTDRPGPTGLAPRRSRTGAAGPRRRDEKRERRRSARDRELVNDAGDAARLACEREGASVG